jgi:hypothetical protein
LLKFWFSGCKGTKNLLKLAGIDFFCTFAAVFGSILVCNEEDAKGNQVKDLNSPAAVSSKKTIG